MSRERSPSPHKDADMEIDSQSPTDKSDSKVVIVTNLTRNVVESHLKVVFGFYGEITKVDLPVFGKSGQNRGKAALEFAESASAHKAASHMDGGQLDGNHDPRPEDPGTGGTDQEAFLDPAPGRVLVLAPDHLPRASDAEVEAQIRATETATVILSAEDRLAVEDPRHAICTAPTTARARVHARLSAGDHLTDRRRRGDVLQATPAVVMGVVGQDQEAILSAPVALAHARFRALVRGRCHTLVTRVIPEAVAARGR
ncbi:RNA-binding protein with serine-rich domain 1-like protein [Psilocybe cubensis]|uniref:RRM domain-containing protein n=2 Tax=Psilocybe cubensis TaxID=181762 RepID=A0A8H7Y0W5_PSICU|nr:RNA-binding protein with serine-rich domain 1-like protein [Psilocybe cubensis]KAH9482604.1 RNA-binding protein with serine-rich domain 1-like protein [Psilocybe cubensis]